MSLNRPDHLNIPKPEPSASGDAAAVVATIGLFIIVIGLGAFGGYEIGFQEGHRDGRAFEQSLDSHFIDRPVVIDGLDEPAPHHFELKDVDPLDGLNCVILQNITAEGDEYRDCYGFLWLKGFTLHTEFLPAGSFPIKSEPRANHCQQHTSQ